MPESVSSVDAIIDGLREIAGPQLDDITPQLVPLSDAVAAVHAAADLASPDERLREAVAFINWHAEGPCGCDGEPDDPCDSCRALALLASFDAAGRAAATPDPDEQVEAQIAAYRWGQVHAAATPNPPDDDKRVRVTCFDPVTGESETQPLDPDNYILTLGARCEITACQVYANGTVQLTIKRGAA